MVSAFSENQLLAQTLLSEVVASDEFMQGLYDADPRPSAWLPVREATEDEDLASFAEAGAEGLPMPAIPEMASVWTAWGDAEELIISGEVTGEEAFQNAAEQIRNQIEEGQ
jgi:maltose-binding protein MalE